jgi:hypothetical protein
MSDDDKPMTLSREDLYELVWSKPMSELAKDFGISDVALAKRCKRLGIPVPGRGYWARIDAGQTPYRPKLPKREAEWSDESALTVAPSVGAYTATILSSEVAREILESAAPESVAAKIASLTILPAVSILDALPAVKRTAVKEKYAGRSGVVFLRGERSGAVVEINVTQSVLDRALLLADMLLRAAEGLGWTFDDPQILRGKQGLPVEKTESSDQHGAGGSEPYIGRLLVEGEQVGLRIEERFRDQPVTPTAAQLAREKRESWYQAPLKESIATGALRVVRLDTYRAWGGPDRRSWYDRKGKLVEDQIREILLGFYELALSIKERRAKDEREAREQEEAERRREELETIRSANGRLIAQLERDAGAWHRARYLRRYLAVARKSLGAQPLPANFRNEAVDFIEWAERYVNQLDPLHVSNRTGEFDDSSRHQYQSDHEKKALGRLLGGDWQNAFKLGTDYRPKRRPSWFYGEKPVFEVGEAATDDGTE